MNNGHRSTRQRVVITGLGAVTPLGLTANDFWQGLVEGRSGIGPMTLCDASEFPCRIAGEVKGFDPKDYVSSKEVRRLARFSQLGIAASGMAIEDAGLDLSKEAPERVGVLLGNGSGSFPDIDAQMKVLVEKGGMRIAPFFMPMALPNMAAAQISRTFGLRGYNNTVCTACAAASQAIGDAVEVIRRGAADVMLAGGAEAGISQLGLAGFCVMRALSTRNEEPERASRPFEAGRDGFVPAEGAGHRGAGKPGTRHRPRRGHPCRDGWLRRLCRRLSPRAARGERPGSGVGDPLSYEGRRHRAGGCGLHQRPRHVHTPQRRLRDGRRSSWRWERRRTGSPSAPPSP